MAKKVEEQVVELRELAIQTAVIHIAGDGDLILNKMNDPTMRDLMDERNDKAKTTEKHDKWEEIITSLHWRDGKPDEFSEDSFENALKNNAPCISAFGLEKSLGQAVVRNNIDTYSTKFAANVNVIAKNGLIPISFAEHRLVEALIPVPKKKVPVLARMNHFVGWTADITIQYVENAFSLNEIVNIVRLAGFGIGIGSGRSSGYGRYHVVGVN